MKKFTTSLLVLFISSGIFAQESSLKKVLKDYQKKNSETTHVIPSFLIKFGLMFGGMDEKDREILELLDDIKIVISENSFYENDFRLLEEGIKNGKFEEVVIVNDGSSNVRMIVNNRLHHKSEMLMLVSNDEENVMMLFNFKGETDYKKFLSLVD